MLNEKHQVEYLEENDRRKKKERNEEKEGVEKEKESKKERTTVAEKQVWKWKLGQNQSITRFK